MPSAGLSLVGFMTDQQQALHHLRTACIPAHAQDATLLAEWNAAKSKLGASMPKFGQPEILDIQPPHEAYITRLRQQPWVQSALQTHYRGGVFKMVEIDPLLTMQHAVDTGISTRHGKNLGNPASADELLKLCLPMAQPDGEVCISHQPQSVVLKSKSLNLRILTAGFQKNFAGISIGWAPTFVHVVRLNGKYYLHNGLHRAVGARMAGATHMPCVVCDIASPEEASIKQDGPTFTMPLLDSNNPPTVRHFCQERAHIVTLRATTRVVHVSWASYGMYDE